MRVPSLPFHTHTPSRGLRWSSGRTSVRQRAILCTMSTGQAVRDLCLWSVRLSIRPFGLAHRRRFELRAAASAPRVLLAAGAPYTVKHPLLPGRRRRLRSSSAPPAKPRSLLLLLENLVDGHAQRGKEGHVSTWCRLYEIRLQRAPGRAGRFSSSLEVGDCTTAATSAAALTARRTTRRQRQREAPRGGCWRGAAFEQCSVARGLQHMYVVRHGQEERAFQAEQWRPQPTDLLVRHHRLGKGCGRGEARLLVDLKGWGVGRGGVGCCVCGCVWVGAGCGAAGQGGECVANRW